MESTYLPVLADKTLTCRDCGRTFPFTVREQEFYAEKGFNNQPSRCPECRAANKARMAGGTAPVPSATFDRPERQMFPAVCANCGKATQVPFEPRSGRPVYCRDCFVPRPASPGGSSDRGSSFGSGPSGSGPSSSRGSYPRANESKDRGSSFGAPPAPERRATRRAKERRTDWEPSYEVDGDFEDSYSRGSGRSRRS
jgi:CxxC-x17-CxxC domain-containing protein